MFLKLTEPIKDWLLRLPRLQKRVILLVSDSAIIFIALMLSFYLRFGFPFIPSQVGEWIAVISAPIVGVACFTFAGVYRRVTRFAGQSGLKRIMAGVSLMVLIWSLLVFLLGIDILTIRGIPRSVVVLLWAISFLFIWASREAAWWFLGTSRRIKDLEFENPENTEKKRVLIWGYSEAALLLVDSLRSIRNFHPVGIVDDDETLHYQKIDNIKIYPPASLKNLITEKRVTEVFLDSQIVPREKRFEIVRQFESLPVVFKVLPSVQDIVTGKIAIESVKNIRVEDLLGRSAVLHSGELLKASVEGRVIMVTGAGGSIGSELVRQLVRLAPKKLVLFELSEIALYDIMAELDGIFEDFKDPASSLYGLHKPEIVGLIGSVANELAVNHAIKNNSVQIIYHAAAYKHVPIVEDNPVPGLENNSIGTWTIAQAALKHSVERFVLISTDKAVRPTNIMGASKRLAEMVLQGMAAENNGKTIFCMVRFGNVLDSSGSVVPKFRKQIESGGPITVTHPDVIRYFMSIREAVGLVIQAGAMAKDGVIFVLDIGEPVKILELARTMVQLAGQRVRDENNPNGNIEIVFTGLRPGEKLYEELLIGDNTLPTDHPRISQHDEPFLRLSELDIQLNKLKKIMKNHDTKAIKQLLGELVEGYVSSDRR